MKKNKDLKIKESKNLYNRTNIIQKEPIKHSKSIIKPNIKNDSIVEYVDINNKDKNKCLELSPYKIPLKLRLNSISNVRRSMAKIIRLTLRNEIEESLGRTISFQIQTLCAIYKTEAELDLHRRLADLEKTLRRLGNTQDDV